MSLMRNLLLALALLSVPVLSGCMESGDDVAASDNEGNPLKNLLGNLTGKTNQTVEVNTSDNESHLPHVHDYWGERERVLLADETVAMEPWMVFNHVFLRREAAVGGEYWEFPQGKTVYQGTGKMELTTTWEAQSITSLAVAYRHGGSSEWSEYLPLTNGQPLVLDVTPVMTDLPHSGGSRWAFLFKPATAPGVAVGDVRIKVEILRVGDLHAFPAHEDFYADSPSLVLMDAETESRSPSWVSSVSAFARGDASDNEGFTLPEGSIVPPGTSALVLDIKVKDIPARDAYLSFRDASGRWDRAFPMDSAEAGIFRFGIPVEPDGVDSYYATTSAWRFYFQAYGGGGSGGLPFSCGGCTDQSFPIHVRAEAFDDSPFEEEEDEPERRGSLSPGKSLLGLG